MGVGGLLMEIVTRPQPRAEPPAAGHRRIAAVVLAAGRSTRMGGPNKLLAEIAAGRWCASPPRRRWRRAPSR